MQFIQTPLAGAYLIQPEAISDNRGFFARSFCEKEFAVHGLSTKSVQCNISYNNKRGTLRGMHFQHKPNAEAKLVRCTSGAIYDVIIDLRENSPTFSRWVGYELTSSNHNAMYIPEGFAHGFQTLVDDSEVFYQMFNFFVPESAGGVRWDDPAFKIEWPIKNFVMSDKDCSYPNFAGFVL